MDPSFSGSLSNSQPQALLQNQSGGTFAGMMMPPAVPPPMAPPSGAPQPASPYGFIAQGAFGALPKTKQFAAALSAFQVSGQGSGQGGSDGGARLAGADSQGFIPQDDSWRAAPTLGYAGW